MISVAIYTLNDRDDCKRLSVYIFFTFKLTKLHVYHFIYLFIYLISQIHVCRLHR